MTSFDGSDEGQLIAVLRRCAGTKAGCDNFPVDEATENQKQLHTLCVSHFDPENDGTATYTLGAVAATLEENELALSLFKRILQNKAEGTIIFLNANFRYAAMLYDNENDDDTLEGFKRMRDIGEEDPEKYRTPAEETGLLPAVNVITTAQYNVGCAYFEGVGVDRSLDDALRWWIKAAKDGMEMGSVEAMHKLGDYYSTPLQIDLKDPLKTTSPNFKEAFSWYESAAKFDYIPSVCELGLMYRDGKGCVKDEAKALVLLREAAEAGFDIAETAISQHYFNLGMFNKCVQWALRVVEPFLLLEDEEEPPLEEMDIRESQARACWYLSECVKNKQGTSHLPNPLPWKSYFQLAVKLDRRVVADMEKRKVINQLP
eukprot:m.235292 g.235292  ORF g.235292 m.235292 type:complete len:373 (+) comp13916_c1_seq26:83-1201(+)